MRANAKVIVGQILRCCEGTSEKKVEIQAQGKLHETCMSPHDQSRCAFLSGIFLSTIMPTPENIVCLSSWLKRSLGRLTARL